MKSSKYSPTILEGLNKRIFYIAQPIIRLSGFIIITLVLYLFLLFKTLTAPQLWIWVWMGLYFLYIIALEWARVAFKNEYDSDPFRFCRILFNVGMFSWLLAISAGADHLIVLLYAIPLVAATVYFRRRRWVIGITAILIATGLVLGGYQFSSADRMSVLQMVSVMFLLAGLGAGIWKMYNRPPLKYGDLSEISSELHSELDLNRLLPEIIQMSNHLCAATRALVFVLDPSTNRYLKHSSLGFTLSSGRTIDTFIEIFSTKAPDASVDVAEVSAAIPQYFTCHPRSILAITIYSRDRRRMGGLILAHDRSNAFDLVERNKLYQFGNLIGTALENCIVYRKARVEEAKNRFVSQKIATAVDTRELAKIMIQEAKRLVPKTEGVVMHRYEPKTEGLGPIPAANPDELSLWESTYDHIPMGASRMKVGIGIAGQAIKLGESLVVPNVNEHPWFIKSTQQIAFISLMAAPLIDPSNNVIYGTISLNHSEIGAFTPEDEIQLIALACQTARVMTKIRAFEVWKQKGGRLKEIYDEVQVFDIEAGEVKLCSQIVQSAVNFLPFDMARIRLLEPHSDRLVVAATCSRTDRQGSEQAGKPLPLSAIQPFLTDQFRASRSFLIPNDHPDWKAVAETYFYIPDELRSKQTGWQAYDAFLVPLLARSGKVIGLLSLDVPNSGMVPTREVIEQVEVFASAATWALDLAFTYKRMHAQQERTQSLISSISENLAKSKDIRAICEVAVQVGVNIFDAEGCTILIAKGSELELTNSNFLSETRFIGRKKPIALTTRCGLQVFVAATGEPLYFPDESYQAHHAWAGEEEHLTHLSSRRVKSLMIAPLKSSANEVLGVISLENKKIDGGIGVFDEQDFDRLLYFADEVGRAMEMVKRYEVVERLEHRGLEDDIHEYMNWYHAGIVLELDALKGWLERDEIDRVRQNLDMILRRSYTAVHELKSIHTLLRSHFLEIENLSVALQRVGESWSDRVSTYDRKLTIEVCCPPDIQLPEVLKNTIIRVAAGAIANSVKHAGVLEDPNGSIQVCVEQRCQEVILQVRDNGRGAERLIPGYGISRMHQLVHQLRKENIPTYISFDTAPLKGTSVTMKSTLENCADNLPY